VTAGIAAECIDFVAIPVRDLERAVSFYEGTLGFERDPLSHPAFPEYVVGNAALALVEPETMGLPYRPVRSRSGFQTWQRPGLVSRLPVSSSAGLPTTAASATRPGSVTRTGTV
jgi:catechol 2,3-dioxygenase-like lactoylglutathione lyase family enzyme